MAHIADAAAAMALIAPHSVQYETLRASCIVCLQLTVAQQSESAVAATSAYRSVHDIVPFACRILAQVAVQQGQRAQMMLLAHTRCCGRGHAVVPSNVLLQDDASQVVAATCLLLAAVLLNASWQAKCLCDSQQSGAGVSNRFLALLHSSIIVLLNLIAPPCMHHMCAPQRVTWRTHGNKGCPHHDGCTTRPSVQCVSCASDGSDG
jgi:hypothetical protein